MRMCKYVAMMSTDARTCPGWWEAMTYQVNYIWNIWNQRNFLRIIWSHILQIFTFTLGTADRLEQKSWKLSPPGTIVMAPWEKSCPRAEWMSTNLMRCWSAQNRVEAKTEILVCGTWKQHSGTKHLGCPETRGQWWPKDIPYFYNWGYSIIVRRTVPDLGGSKFQGLWRNWIPGFALDRKAWEKTKGVFLFFASGPEALHFLSSFSGANGFSFPLQFSWKKCVQGFSKKAVPGERHPREMLQRNSDSRNAEGGGTCQALHFQPRRSAVSYKNIFWIGCGRREGGRSEHITMIRKNLERWDKVNMYNVPHGTEL